MMKKSNENYTNFDSYEFAEIRRYPYPVSAIRFRYPYPVSATRVFYHAKLFRSHSMIVKTNKLKINMLYRITLPPNKRPTHF